MYTSQLKETGVWRKPLKHHENIEGKELREERLKLCQSQWKKICIMAIQYRSHGGAEKVPVSWLMKLGWNLRSLREKVFRLTDLRRQREEESALKAKKRKTEAWAASWKAGWKAEEIRQKNASKYLKKKKLSMKEKKAENIYEESRIKRKPSKKLKRKLKISSESLARRRRRAWQSESRRNSCEERKSADISILGSIFHWGNEERIYLEELMKYHLCRITATVCRCWKRRTATIRCGWRPYNVAFSAWRKYTIAGVTARKLARKQLKPAYVTWNRNRWLPENTESCQLFRKLASLPEENTAAIATWRPGASKKTGK